MNKNSGRGINDALLMAAQKLSDISATSRLDAEILMAHALGMTRNDMLLRRDELNAPETYAALIERRAHCEPIAYIIGHQDFWDLTLKVTPDVLIPRPDSETIIEYLLQSHADKPPRHILDLGTGSGALLLAALSLFSDAIGVGLDNSEAAILVAQHNAAINGLADRSEFICADWTQEGWRDGIDGRFDLILSNPPYIGENEILMRDVVQYEPSAALFAGMDGLADYQILIPNLQHILTKGGVAIFEIGMAQAHDVSTIAQDNEYLTQIKQDLAGLDRIVILHQK